MVVSSRFALPPVRFHAPIPRPFRPRAPEGDGAWPAACAMAYARAAARASDLYADLCRRAERLIALAPRLRAKGTRSLLTEDACSVRSAHSAMSERAARRLFERRETLGAVREFSGRQTFRLHGL